MRDVVGLSPFDRLCAGLGGTYNRIVAKAHSRF